jgi:hypothetical protein
LQKIPGLQSDFKLLAILIQNSFHHKNSKRTGAIESCQYKDIVKLLDAKMYLGKITRDYILGLLRAKETQLF